MSALFSRLFTLLKNRENNPYEDYLTEIFSGVFASEQIGASFAREFVDPSIQNSQDFTVTTQKTYPKQGDHQTDSRPDIVIQFKEGTQNYTLFWESKLGSGEGDAQLSRYADHLMWHYQSEGCKTYLFYVTKFHDPKEVQLTEGSKNEVKFLRFRWYEVYNWLQKNRNDYVDHVLAYMEDIGLNQTRKFTVEDAHAIQQMGRLIEMMDECIDGPVDDVMTSLFGKSQIRSNRYTQMRQAYRYVKYNDQTNYTAVAIGFYLSYDEYPLVSIFFEANPNGKNRQKMIACMKEFVKNHPDWKAEDLDDPSAWSNISCDVSLQEFLDKEDHIVSIQQFFIGKLKELHTLKVSTPELNWRIV